MTVPGTALPWFPVHTREPAPVPAEPLRLASIPGPVLPCEMAGRDLRGYSKKAAPKIRARHNTWHGASPGRREDTG